jgi:hypothetical protein
MGQRRGSSSEKMSGTHPRLESPMSESGAYPDEEREVEAEGIDPDIPSTDDDRTVVEDDDDLDRGEDEIDLEDLP